MVKGATPTGKHAQTLRAIYHIDLFLGIRNWIIKALWCIHRKASSIFLVYEKHDSPAQREADDRHNHAQSRHGTCITNNRKYSNVYLDVRVQLLISVLRQIQV